MVSSGDLWKELAVILNGKPLMATALLQTKNGEHFWVILNNMAKNHQIMRGKIFLKLNGQLVLGRCLHNYESSRRFVWAACVLAAVGAAAQ
jgi:hypothetical protein